MSIEEIKSEIENLTTKLLSEVIDFAQTARLISGSGNWSSSAGSIYDENTLFMNGYAELTLRLQRDFDKLWAGSKDVAYQALPFDDTRADITDELIARLNSVDR